MVDSEVFFKLPERKKSWYTKNIDVGDDDDDDDDAMVKCFSSFSLSLSFSPSLVVFVYLV